MKTKNFNTTKNSTTLLMCLILFSTSLAAMSPTTKQAYENFMSSKPHNTFKAKPELLPDAPQIIANFVQQELQRCKIAETIPVKIFLGTYEYNNCDWQVCLSNNKQYICLNSYGARALQKALAPDKLFPQELLNDNQLSTEDIVINAEQQCGKESLCATIESIDACEINLGNSHIKSKSPAALRRVLKNALNNNAELPLKKNGLYFKTLSRTENIISKAKMFIRHEAGHIYNNDNYKLRQLSNASNFLTCTLSALGFSIPYMMRYRKTTCLASALGTCAITALASRHIESTIRQKYEARADDFAIEHTSSIEDLHTAAHHFKKHQKQVCGFNHRTHPNDTSRIEKFENAAASIQNNTLNKNKDKTKNFSHWHRGATLAAASLIGAGIWWWKHKQP